MSGSFAGRWESLARKGVEQALREIRVAPDQRQARRLHSQRAESPPPAGAPHVAFLVPRSWAAEVQWESLIAASLQERGARVSVMSCGGDLPLCDRTNVNEAPPPPCRTCRGYTLPALRAHGFSPVTLRDEWATAEGPDRLWPELAEIPDGDLAKVSWEGLPLGRLVDIPVRWFLLGASLGHDPLAVPTRRDFLRAGRLIAYSVERLLDRLQPDTIVVLNGLFLFESIAMAIAAKRGIDVVSHERGFIHNTLFFRRGAPAASYDIGPLWDRWSGVALSAAQRERLQHYLEGRRSGASLFVKYGEGGVPRPDLTGDGRLAVLFTNITWDSAVIGREVAYPDLLAWVVDCVDVFRGRPRDRLVIRIHPAEVKLPGKQSREPLEPLVRGALADLPPNVTILSATDPTDSYQLMDMADVGLVYTSTTGLEMALDGVPTVVAGRTHYRGKGFTVDVDDPQQNRDAIAALLDDPGSRPIDLEAAQRYAYAFFFRALVDSTFVTEPVRGLARLGVTSPAELGAGGNRSLDAICEFVLSREPTLDLPA